MSFLEKFTDKKEDKNSIPLSDGVILNLPENGYRQMRGEKMYNMEKKIEDLHYHIYLKCKNGVCELGFGTKELKGELTGKGLAVFNEIMDHIATLVRVAKEDDENIKSIIFEAAKDSSSPEDAKNNRRLELYKRALKNKFPGYQLVSKNENGRELFEIIPIELEQNISSKIEMLPEQEDTKNVIPKEDEQQKILELNDEINKIYGK